MKKIAVLIATLVAATAFAAEPAKQEAVKKPEAVVAAPATPKEMPKVEKPADKRKEKKEAAKPAEATKSPASAPAPAASTAKDKKAEAPKK